VACDLLIVTGISSCFRNPSEQLARRILTRGVSDIQISSGGSLYRGGTVDAKQLGDGAAAIIGPAVISAAFTDFFYIEGSDRACGIRVEGASHGLAAGSRVTVRGTLSTNRDGERLIAAQSVSVSGTGAVAPLAMVNRSLGGGPWRFSWASGGGQVGVDGATGLSNIGLLARVCGAVTSVGDGWVYLDDGCGLVDGSYGPEALQNVGVRVVCDATGRSVGDFLCVTGVSSCFRTLSGRIARQLIAEQGN
jgi:hypothetical protein